MVQQQFFNLSFYVEYIVYPRWLDFVRHDELSLAEYIEIFYFSV
jgi:hypothetical protein